MGEFKVGRKGHPSRFEWAADPHALAERFEQLDEADVLDHEQLDDPRGELVVEQLARTQAREVELIEHAYVLRPKLRVSVRLPADLSAREAAVLGDWMRQLSFER